MSTPSAHAFICIGENARWLEALAKSADTSGAHAPVILSWDHFDSSPLAHANPNRWAYAYIDDEQVSLDIRLGSLCRSFPYGVVLELAADIPVVDQQLFAHGFQKFGRSDEKLAHNRVEQNSISKTERCYRFRLEEYKTVPDWLNARFWAHPERFHL